MSGEPYRVVLQALAHLLAIIGQDEPVADQVLESRPVKERSGQHHQRVEPAPCLILPCSAANYKFRTLTIRMQKLKEVRQAERSNKQVSGSRRSSTRDEGFRSDSVHLPSATKSAGKLPSKNSLFSKG